MGKFKGFGESESLTPIPDSLFGELLGEIAALNELKVILRAIWLTEHMDGPVRALRAADFEPSDIGLTRSEVDAGLAKAVQQGALLASKDRAGGLYFLNSPRGRAAASAKAGGAAETAESLLTGPLSRPNVFKLYEENIGPLTPLIADALRDAEVEYSEEWVADAIEVAIANNKRSWAYCQAILRRWKDEGRAEKQNRRDDKAARQRDVEKKIRRFIDG